MVTNRRGVGAYRRELALVAVAFAAHILLLGRYAPRYPSYPLAVVQLATIGLLALAWAGVAGERLSGRGRLGAGLILAGMLVAEPGGRQPAAPRAARIDGNRS